MLWRHVEGKCNRLWGSGLGKRPHESRRAQCVPGPGKPTVGGSAVKLVGEAAQAGVSRALRAMGSTWTHCVST